MRTTTVTKRALEAGRHVYSEKPMALRPDQARELIDVATRHGVRLACAPATFLGEAQQTAAAWIREGRLGTIRAVYADVSHGRIETWHPAPQPFFDVGVLVDVAVYPLTLVTTMVGPARAVRAWGWDLLADRTTVDGTPFRIGSPDLIVAALELDGGAVLRLTSSFYVGRPAKFRGGLEFHGDDASFALGNFQEFNASVEVGPYDGDYAPVPYVREPFSRDLLGARRRGPRRRDRGGPAPPGIGGAGGPRRRHPRRRRAVDGRRRAADRGDLVVRAARAHALGGPAGLSCAPWGGLPLPRYRQGMGVASQVPWQARLGPEGRTRPGPVSRLAAPRLVPPRRDAGSRPTCAACSTSTAASPASSPRTP